MRSLIQIVPEMSQHAGGVRDYSLLLAKELRKIQGIATVFIAGSTGCAVPPHDLTSREIIRLSCCTSRDLRNTLDEVITEASTPVLLLHYVNYGYHPRGIPFWLVKGLRSIKNSYPELRLITIFHELYASGRPWRSSFWLSRIQKHLAKKLWDTSDAGSASIAAVFEELARWKPRCGGNLWMQPVFSTVGEPSAYKPFEDREPSLVVFGLAGISKRVYHDAAEALAATVEEFGVRTIYDIGPRKGPVPDRVRGARVQRMGVLAQAEVSKILTSCCYGFINSRPELLGKSTVFAAFASHGLITVLPEHFGHSSPDDPMRNIVMLANKGLKNLADPGDLSRRAFDWYQPHRLSEQALRLSRFIAAC